MLENPQMSCLSLNLNLNPQKSFLLKLALPQAGSQGLNGHIKILGGEIALLEEAWCSGIVVEEEGKTLTGLSPFLNPTHK